MRFNTVQPVGSGFSAPADNGFPHTASVYLTIDQQDVGSMSDLAGVDIALSALLNACVTSRTAGADFVPSAHLTNFLNGEP
jgi:hypothetical protein